MAAIRFSALVERFVSDLERSSATVLRTISSEQQRPARLRVVDEMPTDCLLFLWTITPGGGGAGVRPPRERRIPMTNVERISLEPGVRTLLGGWSEEFDVYAFWDARRHTVFGSSPSLQVNETTLDAAASVGIATQLRPTRESTEVVVAVSRQSLLWYVQHGASLHNAEDDAMSVGELISTTAEDEREFLDSASTEGQSARRYDLVQTMRAYRDAVFRPAILTAYSYQCAVCDCDLTLVDAAHIVPVTHPESTDDVANGIALCRLHHAAYDGALLGVQSNYRIVVNHERVDRLRTLGLDRGLGSFRQRLPEWMRVPSSIEARPSPENLKLGLLLRQWPESFIA